MVRHAAAPFAPEIEVHRLRGSLRQDLRLRRDDARLGISVVHPGQVHPRLKNRHRPGLVSRSYCGRRCYRRRL
jgi:hypothetical protein